MDIPKPKYEKFSVKRDREYLLYPTPLRYVYRGLVGIVIVIVLVVGYVLVQLLNSILNISVLFTP